MLEGRDSDSVRWADTLQVFTYAYYSVRMGVLPRVFEDVYELLFE
jgi:hypothetical protein